MFSKVFTFPALAPYAQQRPAPAPAMTPVNQLYDKPIRLSKVRCISFTGVKPFITGVKPVQGFVYLLFTSKKPNITKSQMQLESSLDASFTGHVTLLR